MVTKTSECCSSVDMIAVTNCLIEGGVCMVIVYYGTGVSLPFPKIPICCSRLGCRMHRKEMKLTKCYFRDVGSIPCIGTSLQDYFMTRC